MSKSKAEGVTLTFDLIDLPTAQHKAGLAGLLLQIQSMEDRRIDPRRVPEIEELTRISVRIMFTRESTQGLLDDLYDARLIDGDYKKPKKKKNQIIPPDEIRERMVKGKTEKRYIYLKDVVQPQAPCLARYMESPENNPWLKLWRDMIWAITRGINTTRAPFNKRAEGMPCPEGAAAWDHLDKFQEKLAQSQFATSPISGALMLAAQAVNAEDVPFSGRNDHNFLLHFWQIVVLTYVPQGVDNDGKPEPKGYVLAIPDVADLKDFRVAFPELLHTLHIERRGFRPADALIDVPVQSSLEFLRHLRDLAADKAGRESWSTSVGAVESYHMHKAGNNIKLLAFDRVVNRQGLVSGYERIRNTFRNPLFRAARLRSLLRDQPWYAGMLELFAERPWPFFVENEKSPKLLPRFSTDARSQLRAIYQDTYDMSNDEMSDVDRLSRIVERLVRKYVEGRAEAKTGKKVKDFPTVINKGKPRRNYPADFREAQQRVCSDAFLAMRSRHDHDFIEYFVGSICAVAQYLPMDDYQFLTKILLQRSPSSATGPLPLCWEDVKALAMTAVSACSYATQPRESKPQEASA